MTIDNLGINPLFGILPLLYWGLLIISWTVLYARGAEARDLLFWGAIGVVIPLLGPIGAIIFALRLKRDKAKRQAPATA